jgi:protein-L-isoaspartate(D-aspartate) O-methyltransferase
MFIRLRGVGSGTGSTVELDGLGLSVEVPSDGIPADPQRLAAALTDPGPLVRLPFPLRQADIWDGFGLWLALTEPGACRLVGGADSAFSDELLPVGAGTGTIALTTAGGPLGAAAIVRTPNDRQAIRPYGPAGAELAAVLVGSLQAWAAVGRPSAPDWQITVVPGETAEAGAGVVPKRHATVVAEVRTTPSPWARG